MSERRPLTASQLSTLAAFLPINLTEKQMADVIKAAEHLVANVWIEAQAAASQFRYLTSQTVPERKDPDHA